MGKNLPTAAKISAVALLVALTLAGCSGSPPAVNSSPASAYTDDTVTRFGPAMERIRPFFRPMGKPRAYDWLGSHNEPGQTFAQYLESEPTKPTAERQKIYVLPLGTFN